MATLKNNYLIKKRNVLNEIRADGMTLQEQRFFVIYLSKINPNNTDTRLVRFSLEDFRAIMELSQIKIDYIKQVTSRLLSKVVNVPINNSSNKSIGYNAFQLFKRCKVILDDSAGGYVEIDAHDDALPLMFEFKQKYFSYHLWNALKLKSTNQLRMYEILKQYESAGFRVISLNDLRGLLWIAKNEYPRFGDFKTCVLNSCQKALAEHTDITFTYEPCGKRGKGGKILYLKFVIRKNENHTLKLSLPEFVQQNSMNYSDDDYVKEISSYDNRMKFLAEACNNEFSILEIIVFHDKMLEILPYDDISTDLKCYDYLMRKYRYMNMQNEKKRISNRRAYLESIIGKD